MAFLNLGAQKNKKAKKEWCSRLLDTYALQISHKAMQLWAKKSKDGKMFWLPLMMHMADSAEVAKKLWEHWVPQGVKQIITTGITESTKTTPLRTA